MNVQGKKTTEKEMTRKKVKLKGITNFIGRGITPSYTDAGIAVLNQKCIRETVSFDEIRFTDPSKNFTEEKLLQLFDIVICSTGIGTLGRVGQIKNNITKTTVDSHVTIVRPDTTKVNAIYLGYLLKKKQNEIEFLAEGSTGQTELPRQKLSNLELTLPPLSEQKRISNILSSFDNKIEILKKENKILEDIAENIFKEWFVKYNFPNKDGKPYRDSNGKMIDSELGPIPEGWRVLPLTEIAEFLNGLAMQKYRPKLDEESLPVIKIREMSSGFTKDTDRASKNIDSKYIVNNGDIIFSWSGTIDITIWKHGQGALNQHLFKVSSNKYPKWFYYFWIKHYLNEYKQIASEKATTMGHIQRRHLEESLVAVPDRKIVDLNCYINKIIVNNDLINNLNKIKNNLLKKLLR